MSNYKFFDGQIVTFNIRSLHGTGTIVGVSSGDQPIIGHTYMVQVISASVTIPNETYPYAVVSIPGCSILSAEKA